MQLNEFAIEKIVKLGISHFYRKNCTIRYKSFCILLLK